MISFKTDGVHYLSFNKEGLKPVAATMEDSSMCLEATVQKL